MYKSKRSRACDIKKSVKDKVWERDKNRCIICQSPFAMPNAHFIPRSKGGLGIEQNIVTLCQECHHITDQTEHRQFMLEKIERYLKSKYDDWDKEDLIYRK
jgi:5-methylcytosine-specific restriction endonuclease McrA